MTRMKVRSAPAAYPGSESGSRMRRKSRQPEEPRFCAASSSERGQRGCRVQKDEGKVVEGLDKDHPPQTVHEGHDDAEAFDEHEIHEAAPAQNLLEGHRAHEGRDH